MKTHILVRFTSLAILAGIAGAWGWSAICAREFTQTVSAPLQADDVYERVMRRQTIRCGYGVWPPFINKDTKSGRLSGIFYDYMEELGKALNLKIAWTEEFGTSDFTPALKNLRIDAMCASIWPNAARAREIDFVHPVYYSTINAYARADDRRFDEDISRIDDPSITIVSMDGELADIIAREDYPKAKRIELPQGSSISEFFVNIAMKKADITFATPAMFSLYNVNNPGKIQHVPTNEPLRVFGNTIAIASGEDRFRSMLNTATDELIAEGKVDKILARYKPYSDMLLRVSQPYENSVKSRVFP